MPDASLWLLILIVTLAVGFGVVNGFNDAANALLPYLIRLGRLLAWQLPRLLVKGF